MILCGATGDIGFIWRQGGVMLLFTVLSLMGALLNMYIAGNIAFQFGKAMRHELYAKVLSFSKQEFDKFGAASLITRNTNDVNQVQTLVDMGFKFLILCPLYLVGGIFMTYRLNPSLAMVFVYAIPFMAVVAAVIYRYASPLFASMQRMLDRLNLLFREGVTGVRLINVDSRTELVVQKAMRRLLEGRTSFVVAHRLPTIYDADNIVVMREGDMVESGTHAQLIAAEGAYHELYQSQFAGQAA